MNTSRTSQNFLIGSNDAQRATRDKVQDNRCTPDARNTWHVNIALLNLNPPSKNIRSSTKHTLRLDLFLLRTLCRGFQLYLLSHSEISFSSTVAFLHLFLKSSKKNSSWQRLLWILSTTILILLITAILYITRALYSSPVLNSQVWTNSHYQVVTISFFKPWSINLFILTVSRHFHSIY